VAWSATVFLRTTDQAARLAIGALLVVAVSVVGPFIAMFLSAPSSWIVAASLVAVAGTVFLLRQRPLRVIWLVAPTIVVATVGLLLSGLPRSVRFAVAEAELTAYVQTLDQAGALPDYDRPVIVGGVPVFEVISEEGQVRLVTGFIGILDDDPAGLAFVPEGDPVGVGWKHIKGPWFTWVPLGYEPD